MNTTKLASSALLALALSTAAQAVHLDPGGRGQVLIYPYYTVNKHQQTLLSVTNTSTVAQAVKVRFKEGYNGRDVRDFNLFLSPFDSWTGTVFALRDAGIDNDGAAIISSDTSCTAPLFSEDATSLAGTPYVALRNNGVLLVDDGGPYTIDRTREGYIEIMAMADIAAPLAGAVAHGSNGSAPTGCAQVRNLLPDNAALSTPTGGLMGSVSIIDVAQGTYLTVRAEALAGFTRSSLFSGVDQVIPNLQSVNDGVGLLRFQATARMLDVRGNLQSLTYPGPNVDSRAVDAVSAVFMADHLFNEYLMAPSIGAASDWLITMPTKLYYTDRLFTGGGVMPPFTNEYDGSLSGDARYSPVRVGHEPYDRNGRPNPGSSFPTPPPPRITLTPFVVNALTFSPSSVPPSSSPVLGSRLLASIARPARDAGWMDLSLSPANEPHALSHSVDGKVLRGLPVIGFWASNIVNNNVSNGVLANYAAAVRHATSVTCVKASDSTPCD